MTKKKETSTEVLIPRSLEQIHSDLGEARHRLDEAFVAFDRGTLADRVWIGVCCLAAQEHHCIQDHSDRGRRKGKKLVTRDELALSDPHPQGFGGWLKVASPWLQRPTAYKYMDAAKGAGLTAWSSEQEARKVIADLLQRFDDLSVKQLVEQGKTEESTPEPAAIKTDPRVIATQAVETHEAECVNLIALRQHFTPTQHDAVVNRFARALQDITGQEWGPVN